MAGARPLDPAVPGPQAWGTVRLLWVAPDGLDAWTGALDAAGFDLRSVRATDASGAAAALRNPLDLVVAWDDATGERAGAVLAAIREAGADVPVAVVAHPDADHELLQALEERADAALEAGHPRRLPARLGRLLDDAWSRARLALTGRIAHELNNLLAPIPLAVQLLQQTGDPSGSPAQLRIVDTASRRSMGAVKELSGLLAAEEPAPLPVLAKHLLTLAAAPWRRLGDRAPDVLTEYPPGLGAVHVDVRPVLQVLWCLSRRALDGVGDGAPGRPELSLSGGMSTLGAGGDAAGVELRVVGAPPGGLEGGLALEAPGRAPEPGDGLKVIQEVLATQDGEVAVLDGQRDPAGYVVRLPVAPSPGAERGSPAGGRESPRPRPDPPSVRGGSVLLIEREGEARRTTRETLERRGFRVLVAGDGTEGVALFAAHQDDVSAVLVDMVLPFMDGMATIRALRRIGYGVPIVLTTEGDRDLRRLAGGAEAPDVVLTRPYDAESLVRALGRAGG